MALVTQNILGVLGIPRDDIFNIENAQPQETTATNGASYSFFPEKDLEWVSNTTGDIILTGSASNNKAKVTLGVEPGLPDQTAKISSYERDSSVFTWSKGSLLDRIESPKVYGNMFRSFCTNIDTTIYTDTSNTISILADTICIFSYDTTTKKLRITYQLFGSMTWQEYYTDSIVTGMSSELTLQDFCLIQIPNGDVLLFSLASDNRIYIRNCTQGFDISILKVSTTTNQLRVCYDPITKIFTLACLNTSDKYVYIYSSFDLCASWVLVETFTSEAITYHDMIYVNSSILYAYSSADNTLRFKRKTGGGNFTDISTTITTFYNQGDLKLALYKSNWLVLMGRDSSATSKIRQLISSDAGSTWGDFSQSYPFNNGGPTTTSDICDEKTYSDSVRIESLVLQNDALKAICTLKASSFEYTRACCLTFGGFGSRPAYIPKYSTIYIPSSAPTTKGWTLGSSSDGDNGSEHILSSTDPHGFRVWKITTSNSRCYYTNSSVANNTDILFSVYPASGGSSTSDNIAIECYTTEGYRYKMRFYLASGKVAWNFTRYDAGSTTTSSFAGVATTKPLEIWLNRSGSTLKIFYRISETLVWSTASTITLTVGTPPTSPYFAFGNLPTGYATSYWGFVGGGDYNGFLKMPLSTAPLRLRFENNTTDILRVSSKSLITELKNISIETFSRTGLYRALPSPLYNSPRQNYVAQVTPNTKYYTVFDAGSNYNGRLGDLVGCAVLGSNAKLVTLEGWTGSAWSSILTLSPFEVLGTNCAWVRSSTSDCWFRPNGDNGKPRYFRENQLAGCLLTISDNAGNTVTDTCVANTSGQFTNATGAKQMNIQLSGSPKTGNYATLATSVGTGSPGIIIILWPDTMAIGLPFSSTTRYYRITFTTNDWETELRIGKIIPYNCIIIPRQQSVGGQITYQANDEVTQLPYAYMRGRKLAPSSRIIRTPWRQLLLGQKRYAGGTAVNTIGPGDFARSVQDDNLDKLQSMIETTGTSKPIIWTPEIYFAGDPATVGPIQIYGKDAFLWGTIQGEITATLSHGMRYATNTSIQGYHTLDTELVFKEIV